MRVILIFYLHFDIFMQKIIIHTEFNHSYLYILNTRNIQLINCRTQQELKPILKKAKNMHGNLNTSILCHADFLLSIWLIDKLFYNLMYFISYIDGDLSLLGSWNLLTPLGQRKHSIRCARLGGNLYFSS